MASKNILCIVEGEVSELKILNKLNAEFIQSDITFIPLRTNIYHFYHSYLKEKEQVGDEIDIFIFLKNYDQTGALSSKRKRDFVAIYLFLDLELQEPLSRQYPNYLPEMLKLFDNETENGKLYISYPMIEAFQHIFKPKEVLSYHKMEKIKKYKKLSAENAEFLIDSIDEVERNILESRLITHVKQSYYLFTDCFCYPDNYQQDSIKIFDQYTLYEHQSTKFFINQQILILSPFALFLLEYLGEKLFNQWKSYI